MCHLLFALPFIALPLFWLVPLPVAIPLYALALLVAVATYVYAYAASRRPVEIGRERLYGINGTVLDVDPMLRVKVDGDIWRANCPDTLTVGDPVRVVGIHGLTLSVREADRR